MIFVYSKQRHGGPVINGTKVPGWLDPLPPARITHRVYYHKRHLLHVAPYTKGLLECIFGGEFPDLTFTMHQVKYLNHSQLVVLCQALKITSSKIQSTEDRQVAVYNHLKENG